MIPATGFRRLIAPFSALVLMSGVHAASAQEISASHLEAARAAIASINATEQFDEILPSAARALKGELIQKDPNLEALITKTVDDKALALASRRADLETDLPALMQTHSAKMNSRQFRLSTPRKQARSFSLKAQS